MDDPYRYDVNKLMAQYVPDPVGNMVPLSSLAHVRFVGGFGDIQRADQKRVITVTGNNAEGYNAVAVLESVQKRLADLPLPPGYRIRYRGQNEEQTKASDFLWKAFAVALMLIALLIIGEFNSISQSFIIMTAVLMSLVGVFAGLLWSDLPFSVIMTGIAVIGLAGVVVNNGIVLLAYTKQLEEEGMDTYNAIIKAGKTRLRPVLLTAITTVLGLVPTAMGISFDVHEWAWDFNSASSQFWKNMAVTMIWGLSLATFLTLLVEPVLYSLFRGAWKRLKRFWKGEEEAASPAPAESAARPTEAGGGS
jgi:multidrug efflux pump subunit AcrB